MPIEIRELVIRVTVEERKKPSPKPQQFDLRKIKKEIVEESVEECLRILAKEKER